MSIEYKIIVVVFIALFLLSLCVLLFSSSLESDRLKKYIPAMLWCFGILPGFIGVIWGFFKFVTAQEPILMIFSFLLLEFGSLALLRAVKKINNNS